MTAAYTVPWSFGSNSSRFTPPWNQSLPVLGLVLLAGRENASDHVDPPSLVSYSPSFGPSGGVRRPPSTDESPWRASAVPIRMWFASPGSTAIVATYRPFEIGRLAATG